MFLLLFHNAVLQVFFSTSVFSKIHLNKWIHVSLGRGEEKALSGILNLVRCLIQLKDQSE